MLGLCGVASGFECFWDRPNATQDRAIWHVAGEGWALPTFDSVSVFFPGMHHQLVAVERSSGQVRWQVRMPYVATCASLDTSTTYGFAATMAAGSVVAMDDGLFGFDPATGALRWTFRAPGCMAEVSWPSSDGQTVYAGAAHAVYAIDGASGAVRWRAQFLPDSVFAVAFSPVADNGDVYAEFNIQVATFPFDSGGVVALDAATGALKWLHYFPRARQNYPPRGTHRVALTAALVVAPSDDGFVYALDRATGQVVWDADHIGVDRPVAAAGPTVFVGSNTGLVVALDASSGQQRWQASNSGSVVSLVADAQTVYGRVGYSSLLAWNAATGLLRWGVGLINGGSTGILSAPAVDTDRVYAGANDGYYAFRK